MTDLRSKVAEEIWNVTEGGDENPYNEAMTTDQDIARFQADAAIAVIAQALLSEASVEAAAETMFNESQDYPAWDDLSDEWGSDYGLGKNFYRSASRTQLRAALTAIGAVTEEGGER